jgi:ubiquinone/menaquinone biosynthesis C-methylase UbiE
MEQSTITHLIEKAVDSQASTWADFGSGNGAFTLALRALTGPEATIYSIDKNATSLHNQKEIFQEQFPASAIHFLQADFTGPLEIPPLDGILMANALHFVKNKIEFLKKIKSYLRPGGKLLIVEYETDKGNPFVPYPLSYKTFVELMDATGFQAPETLATAPSRYWGKMYSAVVRRK